MPLHRQRAQKYLQKYLQKFDFESLFIEELGWDTVDRVTFALLKLLDLKGVAQMLQTAI